MARLAGKYKALTDSVKRLNNGDIYTPFIPKGKTSQRVLMAELEDLRRNLLAAHDKQLELTDKNRIAIANVAHDLKTPLTVISGYAECLSDGMDDKDYADLIMQKCTQMNELVLTLVENAKQEREALEDERIKIGARVFFSSEIKKHSVLIEKKGLQLKVGKIPDVNLRINKGQIARVVQNLLSNAVKFTDKGEISITFHKHTRFLAIKVRDSGKGIPKKDIPLLFDKFFKGDTSRTNTANSGLGLYISKEIITAHGGTLTASGKEGKGSIFTAVLPIEMEPSQLRKFYCNRFDRMSKGGKFIVTLLFGFATASLYRLSRYKRNRITSTFAAALWSVPFFVFIWLMDILSVFLSGRITLLAD